MSIDPVRETFEESYREWCARRKAERQARREAAKLRPRPFLVRNGSLPYPKVFIRGPAWRHVGIERRLVREVVPADALDHYRSSWRKPGAKVWVYDVADDVRELVCEPIRIGIDAMWSDPRERWASSCRRT